jgi:hypothetical protein
MKMSGFNEILSAVQFNGKINDLETKLESKNGLLEIRQHTLKQLEAKNAEHLATIGQLRGRVAELVDALHSIDAGDGRITIKEALSSSQPTADAFVKQIKAEAAAEALREAAKAVDYYADKNFIGDKLSGAIELHKELRRIAADKLK